MEEYIFKYLDKRHTIEGNTVYFKDDEPYFHIENMFSLIGDVIVHEWTQNRIGKNYVFKFPNGDNTWYQNGKKHRLDGPAVIKSNGTEKWFIKGKKHRLDGPAIIRADGVEWWYQNGKIHRDGGPAVIHADGKKEWWQKGKLISYRHP